MSLLSDIKQYEWIIQYSKSKAMYNIMMCLVLFISILKCLQLKKLNFSLREINNESNRFSLSLITELKSSSVPKPAPKEDSFKITNGNKYLQ